MAEAEQHEERAGLDPILVFTLKCNLPPNASTKFLNAKILPEDPGTLKSEIDELQNDRI